MNSVCSPDRNAIAETLQGFLLQQSPELDGDLTVSTLLADIGVDSFALIEIMLFVERTYNVRIPLESLTPEIAQNLLSLSDAVVAELEARKAVTTIRSY